MEERNPYLYINNSGNFLLYFYTYKPSKDANLCFCAKELKVYGISEAEARTKYPTIYAAALENFEKMLGITQTQKDEAIIEITQPSKEGIEQIVTPQLA
jgi:hypothetical protein